MSGGKVVALGRMSDEQTAKIAAAGVGELSMAVDTKTMEAIEAMGLSEPQYGETFAAHCGQDEQDMFCELWHTTKELEEWTRSITADMIVGLGEDVRDTSKDLMDISQSTDRMPKFESDEECERFFRMHQRKAFLHQTLHWTIGERLGLHRQRLGVRKPQKGDHRLRIVRLEHRLGPDYAGD